jgi:Flp pilus assembly protein TadG
MSWLHLTSNAAERTDKPCLDAVGTAQVPTDSPDLAADGRSVRQSRDGSFLLSRFLAGRSGNVSIVFAISLLPMIGLVGLGVDYGIALSDKTKLDNAADAAVLAAVSTAKAYIAQNAASQSDPDLTSNAKAAGQDRGARAFTVNGGSLLNATTPAVTPNLSRSGQTFTASLTYQTNVSNNFGRLFNQPTITIGSSTQASADIPSYLDFYLLIDVSASMGLPSTSDGQNVLAAHNSNCQFACHFPDQNSGYNYAVNQNNNIQLRSGAVNTAVCNLLSLAAKPSVKNQYRVGLYPFITQMATLASLTSTISTLQLAATCNNSPPTEFTTLLDMGTTQLTVNNDQTTGTGSGGTHFETSLATMRTVISPYGDGSSAQKSKPFVFLITDGMENKQYFARQRNNKFYQPYIYQPGNSTGSQPYDGSWWTGSSPQAIDPSLCSAIKQQGAIISILYIPYTIGSFVNDDQWETTLAQNVITATPSLQTQLQSCASPGYFYPANTPADINTALAAMFAQAVQMAHLLK